MEMERFGTKEVGVLLYNPKMLKLQERSKW